MWLRYHVKKESLIIGLGLAGVLGLGAFFALRTGPAPETLPTPAAPQAAPTQKTAPIQKVGHQPPLVKQVSADRKPSEAPAVFQGTARNPASATEAHNGAPESAVAVMTTPAFSSQAAVSPASQTPSPGAAPPSTIDTDKPATPQKKSDETGLKIKEDTVIGIRIDQTVSTDTSRVDDRITARVIRDVTVDGHTAIPSGARLEGAVSLVERNQRGPERRRIGIRFTTLILADSKRVAIHTDQILRDTESSGEPSAALSGSSALGAMLTNGARLSSTGPMTLRPGVTPARDARIQSGTSLTVRLTAAVTIER